MFKILPMTEYKTKKERDREYLNSRTQRANLGSATGMAAYLASDHGPDGHTELGAQWADLLHAEKTMDNFESTTYHRRSDKR